MTYDMLMGIMEADNVEVETGDMVCLHTGLSQRLLDMEREPDDSVRELCAVLDGRDDKLLQWVTDSGVAALISDNLAVERSSNLGPDPRLGDRGPALPLRRRVSACSAVLRAVSAATVMKLFRPGSRRSIRLDPQRTIPAAHARRFHRKPPFLPG